MLGTIELTPQDRADAVHIKESWRWLRSSHEHDPKRVLEANVLADSLFRRLMSRKAIPVSRLNVFFRADHNGGNVRSSQNDIFASNARGQDRVFLHQQFWKWLLYFIDGPDLPRPVQQAFEDVARDSFREWDTLQKLARQHFKAVGREKFEMAEQFFRLALDCDCSLSEAMDVRRAVIQTQVRR